MFEYAVKNITKRWSRSLLTIAGVAVMMTLVTVITGIVSYQIRTMNAHAAAGSGKINVQPVLSGTSYPAEGIDMPEADAAAILLDTANFTQEELSSAVLYFTLKEPLYPNQPPNLILTGITPGYEEAFTGSIARDVKPVLGAENFAEDLSNHPIILGEHAAEVYAEELNTQIISGLKIDILDQPCTVIGVLDHSADMVVNNAVMMPLPQAQELLDKPGFVSSLILIAQNVNEDENINTIIEEKYPRMNIITDDTVRKNAQSGIKVFEAMVNTISVVVVLCAAMLIMTVTLITVKERTKEIGVLRALGASTRRVILTILLEIFLLSLIGSILGAISSGFVLSYALDENLFDLVHIISYLPLAIVLTLFAGIIPAVNVSRILPVEALRYE